MGKTRVGVLLRENLGASKSSNRSADLVSLSQKYVAWTKKMRSLIVALEKYHASIGHTKATREAVSLFHDGRLDKGRSVRLRWSY